MVVVKYSALVVCLLMSLPVRAMVLMGGLPAGGLCARRLPGVLCGAVQGAIQEGARGGQKLRECLRRDEAVMGAVCCECGTAVHMAAAHNNPHAIRILKQRGASLTTLFKEKTPLATAVFANADLAVRELVRLGVSPDELFLSTFPLLSCAVRQRYGKTGLALLAAGANPLATDKLNGATPLHEALQCAQVNPAMVCALLKTTGSAVWQVKDNDGRTPLDYARGDQLGRVLAHALQDPTIPKEDAEQLVKRMLLCNIVTAIKRSQNNDGGMPPLS